MSTRTSGRHRMPVRPRTPLTTIGDAVSTSASSMSRRSAVIAASSGLVVTMGLPAAGATPLIHASSDPTPTTTSQAADPAVAAPSGADVSFAVATLTTVDGAQYAHDAAVAAAERDAAATAASRGDADRGGSSDDSSTSTGSTGSAVTVASTTVASSALGSAAVDLARRYIGIPYRFGGTTPAGFDCSGFVQYVYGHLGVSLPRTASEQSRVGTRVSASEARPGDIVSFYGSGGVFHNGIYLGNNRMINSPRTGQRLQEQAIWSSRVVFTRVSS